MSDTPVKHRMIAVVGTIVLAGVIVFLFWVMTIIQKKPKYKGDKEVVKTKHISLPPRDAPILLTETTPSFPLSTTGEFPVTHACMEGIVALGETQKFLPLCKFSCSHGYCPLGTCECTRYGKESDLPPETGVQACSIQGKARGYQDLCAFACAHGYCPEDACTTECEELGSRMRKLESFDE